MTTVEKGYSNPLTKYLGDPPEHIYFSLLQGDPNNPFELSVTMKINFGDNNVQWKGFFPTELPQMLGMYHQFPYSFTLNGVEYILWGEKDGNTWEKPLMAITVETYNRVTSNPGHEWIGPENHPWVRENRRIREGNYDA